MEIQRTGFQSPTPTIAPHDQSRMAAASAFARSAGNAAVEDRDPLTRNAGNASMLRDARRSASAILQNIHAGKCVHFKMGDVPCAMYKLDSDRFVIQHDGARKPVIFLAGWGNRLSGTVHLTMTDKQGQWQRSRDLPSGDLQKMRHVLKLAEAAIGEGGNTQQRGAARAHRGGGGAPLVPAAG